MSLAESILDLVISPAAAQAGGPSGAESLISLLPLVGIFAVFYFLMIRPQQKRVKEHKKMVEGLAKGDEIVTNGGVLGRIGKVGDNFVNVEVANGVELRVQRGAVAQLLPKGTIKSADKSD